MQRVTKPLASRQPYKIQQGFRPPQKVLPRAEGKENEEPPKIETTTEEQPVEELDEDTVSVEVSEEESSADEEGEFRSHCRHMFQIFEPATVQQFF